MFTGWLFTLKLLRVWAGVGNLLTTTCKSALINWVDLPVNWQFYCNVAYLCKINNWLHNFRCWLQSCGQINSMFQFCPAYFPKSICFVEHSQSFQSNSSLHFAPSPILVKQPQLLPWLSGFVISRLATNILGTFQLSLSSLVWKLSIRETRL